MLDVVFGKIYNNLKFDLKSSFTESQLSYKLDAKNGSHTEYVRDFKKYAKIVLVTHS
jgi:hypothetical protein